jgi:N-acetylglucosamine-6-sulfatase
LCGDNWESVVGQTPSVPSPPAYRTLADNINLPQGGSFNEANISDKPGYLQEPNNPPLDAGDISCTQKVWRDRLESLKPVDVLLDSIRTALFNKMQGGSRALDNTVIIFTSDNGYYNGQHRLHQKVFPYEEGIRVPLVIRYKDTPQATQDSHFTLNTDLATTILDLAGGCPPGLPQTDRCHKVDGQSIVGFLDSQIPDPNPWRKRFLLEHWFEQSTPYPGIPNFLGVRTIPGYPDPLTTNAVYLEYDSDFDGTFEGTDDHEYYDLDTDATQLTNAYGSVDVTQLQTFIDDLKTCGGGPGAGDTSCQTLENATAPPI